MTAKKRTGHKSELSLDGTKLVFVKSITPPSKSRGKIDLTDLDDEIMIYTDEDVPEIGEVELEVYWHPNDTNAELLDTLFDQDDPDDRIGEWVITYTKHAVTDSFSGFIVKVEPSALESKAHVGRKVTIQPTTTITRAAVV